MREINTQLNIFLIESRGTLTDTDMMVLTNLVDNVICRYFRVTIFLYTWSRFIDKSD